MNLNIEFKITIIFPNSELSMKERAQNLARITNKESFYDFLPYSVGEPFEEKQIHAFIVTHENQDIALCTVELSELEKKLYWVDIDSGNVPNVMDESTGIFTITYIWVANEFRQRGISKYLVSFVCNYFNLTPETIGWLTPFSDLGIELVRSVCPVSFFVGKNQ